MKVIDQQDAQRSWAKASPMLANSKVDVCCMITFLAAIASCRYET